MHGGLPRDVVLQVTTPKYAESDTFARQVLDNPITLVRGLVAAIGFDLSVFTSAAIASEHGNDRIEVSGLCVCCAWRGARGDTV